jgi:hypothetical protein
VHGLEEYYSGYMLFSYLNIDDPAGNPFKDALGYRYQPHIFLLDPLGNIIEQWVGYVDLEVLEAAILSALGY